MAGEPVIVFDTTSLRQISWSSPAFRQLVELSAAGSVKVLVPEIVYEERRTQWREDFEKSANEVAKTLDRLAGDPLLTAADQAGYRKLLEALPVADAERRSREAFERFFARADFGVVRITQAHAAEAFARYFAGRTPFKSVKARNDIPDGFVFAAAAEVVAREGKAYCLCSDNQLSIALKELAGVELVGGVEDVLKKPELIALADELETNATWIAVRDDFPMDRAREELTDWIVERAPALLEGKVVWSERIPSDDNEGTISFHNEPGNVVISEFTEWGSGDLTATVSFDCDVEVEFPVYRGDAYATPEWVHVTEGDFEADHYFDATGDVRVAVKMDVSVQAVISKDYDAEDEVLKGVTIEQQPRISFMTGL